MNTCQAGNAPGRVHCIQETIPHQQAISIGELLSDNRVLHGTCSGVDTKATGTCPQSRLLQQHKHRQNPSQPAGLGRPLHRHLSLTLIGTRWVCWARCRMAGRGTGHMAGRGTVHMAGHEDTSAGTYWACGSTWLDFHHLACCALLQLV